MSINVSTELMAYLVGVVHMILPAFSGKVLEATSKEAWSILIAVHGYNKPFTLTKDGCVRTIAYGKRAPHTIKGGKIDHLRTAMRLTTGRPVINGVEEYWVSPLRAERIRAFAAQVKAEIPVTTTPPTAPAEPYTGPALGDDRHEAHQTHVDRKPCPRCKGEGVLNGGRLVCYRCGGKGYQTPHDEARNDVYDRNHPRPRPPKPKKEKVG